MPKTRSEPVDAVKREARALFEQGHWPLKEETLAKCDALGKQLKFLVSAKGCGPDGEWLYDMSWSETCKLDGGGYLLVGQPLVLETEERPDKVLDGDFQKLVQARADVRVWIAKVNPKQSVQDHVAKCKEQIKRFVGSQPDDTYVFMIYDSQKKASFFDCFPASTVT
jgi:hypothetical protein